MELIAAGIVLAGGVIAFAVSPGGESKDAGMAVLIAGGIIFAIEYYRVWKERRD